MGPQPCGRGNGPQVAASSLKGNQLQWGRNPAVAEMFNLHCRSPFVSPSFNGAATLRSRKSSHSWALAHWNIALQWGRNPAVAEMPEYPSHRSAESGGFNGAATLRSRKWQTRRDGPREGSRFNGAATLRSRKSPWADRYLRKRPPLQWGRNPAVAEMLPDLGRLEYVLWSFNGAATLRSRKSEASWCVITTPDQLQWGRNPAVAEIRRVLVSPLRPMDRFNGAATLRSRKCARPLLAANRHLASMGPQPCGRGNICHRGPSRLASALASMGPQPCGRGNKRKASSTPRSVALASMGPQPCGRGNLNATISSSINGGLQWGRNPAVAEISHDHYCLVANRHSFNGAATLRSRKSTRPLRCRSDPRAASMGPQPCGRGNRVVQVKGIVR